MSFRACVEVVNSGGIVPNQWGHRKMIARQVLTNLEAVFAGSVTSWHLFLQWRNGSVTHVHSIGQRSIKMTWCPTKNLIKRCNYIHSSLFTHSSHSNSSLSEPWTWMAATTTACLFCMAHSLNQLALTNLARKQKYHLAYLHWVDLCKKLHPLNLLTCFTSMRIKRIKKGRRGHWLSSRPGNLCRLM